MIKPGYKTSEFWFTLVSFLFSGAYLVGLLDSNHQKEDLIQETTRGLEALILVIGQLAVLFRYIKGRTEIKKTWWSNHSDEDTIDIVDKNKPKSQPKPKKERKTNVKPRPNKSRNRKTNKQ